MIVNASQEVQNQFLLCVQKETLKCYQKDSVIELKLNKIKAIDTFKSDPSKYFFLLAYSSCAVLLPFHISKAGTQWKIPAA